MAERRRSVRDQLTEQLYRSEYWRLVGLARLLVDRREDAEDVVHEAFAKMYASFRRIEDRDRALAYLRSIVLNLSRSRLRRRRTARNAEHLLASSGTVDEWAAGLSRPDRDRVIAAIKELPRRQADCVVLQFYLDCSEREIADTLGISPGSVKQHLSRARSRLAERLEALA